MSRPPHQRLVLATLWLLAGVVALGALLDAISNAISLVTPMRALVASALVLSFWCAVEFYARKKGIAWLSSGGVLVKIIRLGWSVRLGVFGVLALLWLPTLFTTSQVQPSKRTLYERVSDLGRPAASRVTLDEVTKTWHPDIKQALESVSDSIQAEKLLHVGLRVGTDLFVVERHEHVLLCSLRLFRFRDDAGLKPLAYSIEEPACEARYEKVSRFLEDAVVGAIWGGNQQVLSIQILLWVENDYLDLARGINNVFPRGQFAFADLDEDGNKELVVTQATDLHMSRPEEFHFFVLDLGELTYVQVDPASTRYKEFLAKFDQILDKSVTEWLGPPNN